MNKDFKIRDIGGDILTFGPDKYDWADEVTFSIKMNTVDFDDDGNAIVCVTKANAIIWAEAVLASLKPETAPAPPEFVADEFVG